MLGVVVGRPRAEGSSLRFLEPVQVEGEVGHVQRGDDVLRTDVAQLRRDDEAVLEPSRPPVNLHERRQSLRIAGLVGPCLLEVGHRLVGLPGAEDDMAEVDEHPGVARPKIGCAAEGRSGLVEAPQVCQRTAELTPGVRIVRGDLRHLP